MATALGRFKLFFDNIKDRRYQVPASAWQRMADDVSFMILQDSQALCTAFIRHHSQARKLLYRHRIRARCSFPRRLQLEYEDL
jgi:hypothetical protein